MNQNKSFEKVKGILNTQLKADLTMLIITMFWGSSYLFMKMGLDAIFIIF
jgi:hypothetical protein